MSASVHSPVNPLKRRTVASLTVLTPSFGRPRFKTVLWISLGLTALFVFITSEVLLFTDYPCTTPTVCR